MRMRSGAEWERWFERQKGKVRKKSGKHAVVNQKTRRRGSGIPISGVSIPRVVGEPLPFAESWNRSNIEEFADRLRRNPPPAEAKLECILNQLSDGVLRGKFERQYIISGKWIVDFFFGENRLAIEVDGSIHRTAEQKRRDSQKDADCAKFDITVLRITNRVVNGNRSALIAKLRAGWNGALHRENRIIGKNPEDLAIAARTRKGKHP